MRFYIYVFATDDVDAVVREQGRTLLSDEWQVVPSSEMVWDDVILLCSGVTDT